MHLNLKLYWTTLCFAWQWQCPKGLSDFQNARRPMKSASYPAPVSQREDCFCIYFFLTKPPQFYSVWIGTLFLLFPLGRYDLDTTMFTQSNCGLFSSSCLCIKLFLCAIVSSVRVFSLMGLLVFVEIFTCLRPSQCSSHVLTDLWPWPGDDTLRFMWSVTVGYVGTL